MYSYSLVWMGHNYTKPDPSSLRKGKYKQIRLLTKSFATVANTTAQNSSQKNNSFFFLFKSCLKVLLFLSVSGILPFTSCVFPPGSFDQLPSSPLHPPPPNPVQQHNVIFSLSFKQLNFLASLQGAVTYQIFLFFKYIQLHVKLFFTTTHQFLVL